MTDQNRLWVLRKTNKERQGTEPGPLKMVLSGSHLRNRNEITVLFRKGQKKPQSRREKATYNVLPVVGGKDGRNESDYPRYRPMAVRDSRFSQPSAPFFHPLRSLELLRSMSRKSGSLCLRWHV